jgi:type VI secretion system secreted protein VgrG
MVGSAVTIGVKLGDGETYRPIHGIVSRFSQSGDEGRFAVYQAEVVPKLWLLTRAADCRIFQEKSVPSIIEEVFSDFGVTDYSLSLTANYDAWDYCVQYRETAFNFVSRLMEQEGIFYFFRHEDGKHTLVLADSASAYAPCPNQSVVDFQQGTGAESAETADVVRNWRREHELRPGKYALTDYNFETPSTSLLVTTNSIISEGGNEAFEMFDYPGEYENSAGGEAWVKARMEEEEAPHDMVAGRGSVRTFLTGHLFELSGHPRTDQNDRYLLTSVSHNGSNGDLEAGGSEAAVGSYSNSFTGIKSTVVFRPPRVTPRPLAQGTQPALVVGPSSEEIHTDSYGRVKVQFYWDRRGGRNENSSCWIRVSQLWAGKGWGAIYIPRIGQEVLVDFLEGDPDRPVVVGRLYNDDQRVPYTLPDEKTKSTIKSNSSTGSEGFNEFRFEDKKGEEQVFLHGEKDLDIRIKNDRMEWIGRNRHLIVKQDKFETVENNRHEKVTNDHVESIGKDRHLKVTGKEAKEVGGSLSLKVTGDVIEKFEANHSEQVTGDVYIKGANIVIEATTNVTIKVGSSFVAIESSGITISAAQLELTGTGTAELKSPATTVKSDGIMTVQGSLVKIN